MIRDKLDAVILQNYANHIDNFDLEVSPLEYEQLYHEIESMQHMSTQPQMENGQLVYKTVKMSPLKDKPTIYYCSHRVVIKD